MQHFTIVTLSTRFKVALDPSACVLWLCRALRFEDISTNLQAVIESFVS